MPPTLVLLTSPTHATGTVVVVAQVTTAPVVPSWLDQVLGPAGALVLLLMTGLALVSAMSKGLIQWGPSVTALSDAKDAQIKAEAARADAAEARADKLQQANDELNRELRRDVIPAMTTVANALADNLRVIDRLERDRR